MAQMTFGTQRAPRNLIFGAGQRAALPGYANELGRRPLVVTDARLAAEPVFAEMMAGLTKAGLEVSVFSGTIAELPAECITQGLEQGRGFAADMVIGIGGGSCLDAAKVLAVLLAHGGKISDYFGEFKVPGPVLPLIAIPTTSGTGSEVTPVAVVSDPDRAVKVGIASPFLIPHTAICDPELTYGCPASLTAVSGADALTHAIEAFTTARRQAYGTISQEHVFMGKNALSDHHALQAIRLISGALKRAVQDGDDRAARDDMMLGATLAGLAFGVAGTAAAHAIQYPVGALTHTPHGTGVAVLMPYVMEFNRLHAEPEMAEIAAAMGLAKPGASQAANAQAAIAGVTALFAEIGIPATLHDLGLAEDKLGWTAEMALGATRLVKNNPRPLDAALMLQLVQAAYLGQSDGLAETPAERKAV
ncbi:MAG: iron-containing alcohol dehydrogenase [Cypionkella sp.]